MTEDQSVVGRRRIYYDQTGGEALICSDSEEEAIDDEEEKRDFLEPEDYIIRLVLNGISLILLAFWSLSVNLLSAMSTVMLVCSHLYCWIKFPFVSSA